MIEVVVHWEVFDKDFHVFCLISILNLFVSFIESLLIPFKKRAAEREVIETIGDIMVERVGVLLCLKIISLGTWIIPEIPHPFPCYTLLQ